MVCTVAQLTCLLRHIEAVEILVGFRQTVEGLSHIVESVAVEHRSREKHDFSIRM